MGETVRAAGGSAMRALLASSGSDAARTSIADDVLYKIAENQHERSAAFRLCHDAYVQAGLMASNRCRMRIMPHHLLATSVVFIAVQGERVISTVSLIGDGQLGLPMECAYREEIDALRDPSRWLGEISSLASEQRASDCHLHLLGHLTRLMAQYALRQGLEYLLAAVHPRHARLYQRVLGFQPLGEPKPYPAVRHRPSVALMLDLPRLERERHPSYRAYFREPIADEDLRYRPISGAERRFFSLAVTNPRPQSFISAHGEDAEPSDHRLQRATA
jgi:hypothetical protein